MSRTDHESPLDPEGREREWLRQIREERSEPAFEALMTRHLPGVIRCLERIVRDDASADLAQEVFLKVWTRAHQWDGHGEVRGWILRIATNTALNHLRSVRRRREQPLEPAPVEPDEESPVPAWMVDTASLGPEQVVEMAESLRRLRGLIDELPDEKRDVLRLAAEAGLEPREIAAELGIPEGTVRSRLHYARRRIERGWRGFRKDEG